MTTLTRTKIRDLRPADWPDVARIYEEGIRTGDTTFETESPTWEGWRIGCMDGLWRDVVLLERRTAGQTGA